MDRLTKEQRSLTMRAIKSTGSKIEEKLRKALWTKGYRYRKNFRAVYGKPDIVFVFLKIAIFCDSEFWHGYDWENRKHDFKSNQVFWFKKIQGNIERDERVNELLRKEGWIVLRFWGNDIIKNLDDCIKTIESAIEKQKSRIAKIGIRQ
jgi:DNA mismatch endonuclease Vsr